MQYWINKHGPLATDWLLRCGIIRYVQYHTLSKHKDLAKKMSEAVGRTFNTRVLEHNFIKNFANINVGPMLPYDGMGDFWVKSYSDFEAAFLDPEYQALIRPDELQLIDMDSIAVT